MHITTQPTPSRPEFFRLPTKGPDPYFGLTRPAYYRLEERGDIRLVRIRERGKLRGITLIPYDRVAEFIRSQAAAIPSQSTVDAA